MHLKVCLIVSRSLCASQSVLWQRPAHSTAISAGASGAVFGVGGALLGFLLLRRDSIPAAVLVPLRNSMFGFIGHPGIQHGGVDRPPQPQAPALPVAARRAVSHEIWDFSARVLAINAREGRSMPTSRASDYRHTTQNDGFEMLEACRRPAARTGARFR